MNKAMVFGMAAVALLSGGVAVADPNVANESTEVSARAAEVPLIPTGSALQLGGGVTGFTRESARDALGTGGYWDVRAILGTRSYLGAELAYVGSSRAIGTSHGQDSDLLGNGIEAVGRANLPLTLGADLRLTPYAFGGVGWTHYQVMNGRYDADRMDDNTDAFVIPYGAGASLTYGRYVVDARFTYRTVFDDGVLTKGNGDSHDLQNWSAGLMVGYEF